MISVGRLIYYPLHINTTYATNLATPSSILKGNRTALLQTEYITKGEHKSSSIHVNVIIGYTNSNSQLKG